MNDPVSRRDLLQGLVGGVGAGLTLPAVAEAHPVEQHLADTQRVARAAERAKTAGAVPEFLDAHALATLESLAERIVPGASRAGTARFVDTLLAVDSAKNQRRFLNALGAIEGEAIARYGRPWKSLDERQQLELLTAVSTLPAGNADAPWTPGTPVLKPKEPQGPDTLRDHFDHLKKWIAGAYYSSEIGMRELGFSGRQFYASFPGCTHPGGHR
jgi:hypothetical protein